MYTFNLQKGKGESLCQIFTWERENGCLFMLKTKITGGGSEETIFNNII